MTRRSLAVPALALLLAACGGGEEPAEGEVTGEVLEGTISDAMLPIDQLRSRAPLAEPTAAAGIAPPTAGEPAADTGAEDPPEAGDATDAEPPEGSDD